MKHIDQGSRLPCPKAKAPGVVTTQRLQETKLRFQRQYASPLARCKAVLQRLMKLAIVRLAMRDWLQAELATSLIQKLGARHV